MIQEKHRWILEELKVLREKGMIQRPRKRSNKGYANFPIKWSIEGNFKDYGIRENGVSHKAFMSYNVGDMSGIVFIDFEARDKAKENQLKMVLDDMNYISKRKDLTDKYAKLLMAFCEVELSEENVSSSSKGELWDLYNKFRDIYTKYEFYNGIWFIVSDDLQKVILENLEKVGCKDSKEIEVLMSCPFQSFSNRERIDVLKTAIAVSCDEKARASIVEKDFESFKKTSVYSKVVSLVEEYKWIPFGHVGPDLLDEKYYFEKIGEFLIFEDNLKEELRKAEEFYPNVRKEQEAILEKYGVDEETCRFLEDLWLLIIMQDERKELVGKTHIYWTNNLMSKVGKIFGLVPHEAAGLYPDDVENALLNWVVNLGVRGTEKENEKEISINELKGYTSYFGEDAQEFLDIIISEEKDVELKGMAACMGVVRGRVKVLRDANDGEKMEDGDILVTTMTTPDFLPWMEKAGAIVTDEGGVTCHAAIVSREFGTPCIVGTDRATEVLKDGDFVEVNADEGKVVRL